MGIGSSRRSITHKVTKNDIGLKNRSTWTVTINSRIKIVFDNNK
jgi:hypothetical protein